MFENIKFRWAAYKTVVYLDKARRVDNPDTGEMLIVLTNPHNIKLACIRMTIQNESALSAVIFLCISLFFLGKRGEDVSVPYETWFEASRIAFELQGICVADAESLANEASSEFERLSNESSLGKFNKIIKDDSKDSAVNVVINNREWVETNLSNLNGLSVDETYEYVQKNHPLMGCSQLNMLVLNGKESIKELAELADAVTVACYIEAGFETEGYDSFSPNELNQTSIGNAAFIALMHPDTEVRDKNLQWLNQWRKHISLK